MTRWCGIALLSLWLPGLLGCATVTRGSEDVLVIETEPSGAMAEISDGSRCTTPCSIRLKRKSDYVVYLTKAGYQPAQVRVQAKVVGKGQAGMAGNVLVGGLIGAGVDVVTGATKSLLPNPVHLSLVPQPQATDAADTAGGAEAEPAPSVATTPL
jgi:PEGA domain